MDTALPAVSTVKQQAATAHNDRGVEVMGKGLVREAAAEFKQAMKLWPGQANFHNNLGNVCYYVGDYAEAFLFQSPASGAAQP